MPERLGENGWSEWSKHVLLELQAIRRDMEKHEAAHYAALEKLRGEIMDEIEKNNADNRARWAEQEKQNAENAAFRWKLIGGGTVMVWLFTHLDSIIGLIRGTSGK